MKVMIYWLVNFFYKLQNTKRRILLTLILISLVLGTVGYYNSYEINFFEAVYRALSQFAIQTDWDILKDNAKKIEDKNSYIYLMILISAIFAMISVLLGAVLLFMEDTLIKWRTLSISNNEGYKLIIGLGKNSCHYLDNLLIKQTKIINKDVIIIEKDSTSILLQQYKEACLGLIVGDSTNEVLLKKLNIKNAKEIFISAGSDENNIEIVLEILKSLENEELKNNIKIIVSLTPKGMGHYYANNALLDIRNELNIDLNIFCYADEAALDLFEKFDIDFDNRIISSSKPYAIMIIGSGELALQILYHSVIMGTLPFENELIIYCIDNKEEDLKKNIDYLYHGIYSIDNLTIEFLPEYRVSSVHNIDKFLDRRIQNIVVCDDDQLKNIEIATDLVERVFRHRKGSPNILTAIYDKPKIARRIHNISEGDVLLKDVYTFACANKICSEENILSKKRYEIAKFIAQGYGEIFNKNALINKNDFEKVNNTWKSSPLSDKASSLSQAQHIKVKLKSLGLKIDKTVKNNENIEKLLEENRITFDKALVKNGIDTTELYEDIQKLTEFVESKQQHKELIDKYFPLIANSPLKRILNCEHERWNKYHFLNNWKLASEKNKDLKLHNCLKPFSKFEDELKETIVYDLYSFLYIPNYCSQASWKIEDNQKLEQEIIRNQTIIGVTGHTNIYEDVCLINKIDTILKTLNEKTSSHRAKTYKIISPLADGADMLVAERAIKILNAKLEVILPFDIENYKNGFEKYKGIKNKKRFDKLYLEAKEPSGSIKELAWKNDLDKDIKSQFELIGQTIVNESDILIALYDGKPSNGKGGTADIVEYAKREYKKEENRIKELIEIKVEREVKNDK